MLEYDYTVNKSVFTVSYKEIVKQLIAPIYIINGENKKLVNALWDTGAAYSYISFNIINKLSLEKVDKKELDTISFSEQIDGYKVDIGLKDLGKIPNRILYGIDITDTTKEYDAIIGMDIITMGDFIVSNHNLKTSFLFGIPPKSKFM